MADRTCEVGDCTGRHLAQGMCQGHYSRHRRGSPVVAPLRSKRPVNTPLAECHAEECGEPGSVKGMCPRHYELDYRAETRRARRDAWIVDQGGACATCGSTKELEIDHVDPANKSCEVEQLWFRTEAARAAELAKCQVLCRACHVTKSKVDLRKMAKDRRTQARPRAA